MNHTAKEERAGLEHGPEPVDPVTRAATATFGIRYLFPWQRLVIANILDAAAPQAESPDMDRLSDEGARDEDHAARGRQIVLLPTGAGKSLCFQVPALFLAKPTLVVFPLLALMGDQSRRMAEAGLEPVIFRGAQSKEEREECFRRIEGTDGKPPAKLIIANPEVLAGNAILDRIAARGVSHLAIDEAHCVSEWGDTFRPAYLDLARVIERLDPPAVTGFTATASPEVLARTAEVLFGGNAHIVRGESDRPNISYTVRRCHAKDAALVREVALRKRPLVIFCATRGGTERAAALLRETLRDEEIRFYHAGLLKEEKIAVEAWFHRHEGGILTATCAWGLGIDKKNVRTVIHRDPPPTAEAYIQEAGRGGRDGETAEAVLLWGARDRKRISRLPDFDRRRAEVLVRFAESGQCRREILLLALGDVRAGKDAPEGERIACSGCDVCAGLAQTEEEDGRVVLGYMEKNRRCHQREMIADILCEAGNRVTREKRGYQVWKRADFMGIMEELESEGRIRELGYWPWKGTMTTVRPPLLPLLRKNAYRHAEIRSRPFRPILPRRAREVDGVSLPEEGACDIARCN